MSPDFLMDNLITRHFFISIKDKNLAEVIEISAIATPCGREENRSNQGGCDD